MDDLNPTSPVKAIAERDRKQPLTQLSIDRRAVVLGELETSTCIQCGQAPAQGVVDMWASGRFKSTRLRVSLCQFCFDENAEAYGSVKRMNGAVRGFYALQLVAFGASLAGVGVGFLLPVSTLAFLGTWAGSALWKKRRLREQPRLIEQSDMNVVLEVPASWRRVLEDEHPQALTGSGAPE